MRRGGENANESNPDGARPPTLDGHSFSTRFGDLLRWFESECVPSGGTVLKGLQQKPATGFARGLFADRPLKAGTTVLRGAEPPRCSS